MQTLTNWSSRPFTGWLPCTVPALTHDMPEEVAVLHPEGRATGFEIRRGLRVGSARTLWLRIEDLAPNSHERLDLSRAVGVDMIPPPPELPPAFAGENTMRRLAVRVNGMLLAAVVNDSNERWLEADGPAFRAHFRGKVGALTWADVWIVWVPTEPWFRWELMLNAADPTRSLPHEDAPAGYTLTVGDAMVLGYGGVPGPFCKNQRMVHGGARGIAGIGGWLDLMTQQQQETCYGMLTGSPGLVDERWRNTIGGMGVPAHHVEGNGFVRQHYNNAVASLYQTGSPGLGVAKASGNTGGQEGQGFGAAGPEVFDATAGPTCAFIRYLVALGYAKRPCHWREADGSLLRWDEHPNLVLWSGRPHWHPNVGSDKLGLLGVTLSLMDSDGWEGPDRQHWFYPDLWTAAMLTGSRLLQALCEHQARLVWFGETVRPDLSTSHFDSARSVGWFGLIVTSLLHTLDSEEAKRRVRLRARERVDLVYIPELFQGHEVMVWDPRVDDERLVPACTHWFERVVLRSGETIERMEPSDFHVHRQAGNVVSYAIKSAYVNGQWITWQQAVGAFGLFVLAQVLDHSTARALAVDAGRAVFNAAWRNTGGTWKHWETLAVADDRGFLPAAHYAQGVGGWSDPSFRHWAMPLAVWVAARDGDQEALALWERLNAETTQRTWLPPLDRNPSVA